MCHFVSNLHISDQSGRFHLFPPSLRWVTHGQTWAQPALLSTWSEITFLFFSETCSLNALCQSRKPVRKLYSECSNKTQGWKREILASAFSFVPQHLIPSNLQMPNSQIPQQEPCNSNATEGLQQSHLG